MKTGVIRSVVAVVGMCGLCAAGADAAMYQWDWTRGEPIAAGLNDNGGTFESINTTFDTVTNEFLWEVTFSDQVTQGYTLVVSPGPNPKGHPGELAIFYLDARNAADPKMSVYAYNGQNTLTSYRDGSPASGTQTPDRITNSSAASSLFPELSVVDHSGKRTITFRMDATDVNTHFPLYPNSEGNDWTGAAYGSQLGIWFHPLRNLSASYNDEGFLTNWSGQQGWIDGAGFTTTLVPTPGSVVLGAMGGVMMLRRRGRKAAVGRTEVGSRKRQRDALRERAFLVRRRHGRPGTAAHATRKKRAARFSSCRPEGERECGDRLARLSRGERWRAVGSRPCDPRALPACRVVCFEARRGPRSSVGGRGGMCGD